MHEGKLTEPLDAFAHPSSVREKVATKAMEMRSQGFFGPGMLPMTELEYTGIADKLHRLEDRFKIRAKQRCRLRPPAGG